MRNELEQMEIIDNYLMGKMSAQEKANFESEMSADPALKSAVSAQRDLIAGMQRIAYRADVAKAAKSYARLRLIRTGAIIMIIVAAAASAYFLLNSNKGIQESKGATSVVEVVSNEVTDLPESVLPLQKFEINTLVDTIVETAHGIVMAIPANCFETDANVVTLEVREALYPDEMMKAGLNTMSGDKMLETAGMFSIEAKHNGVQLGMKKEIIVEVPANEIKPNIQLFDGVRKSDGVIDWVNPKPVEVYLNNVDVISLDFYPPDYLSGLKKLKQNADDKFFTDSLYWSLEGGLASTANVLAMQERPVGGAPEYSEKEVERLKLDVVTKSSPQREEEAPQKAAVSAVSNNIEPSQIRTIWNEKWNKTLVATREFEERIKVMHRSCEGGAILRMYLERMDEKLSVLDNIASSMSESTTKEFRAFAARKEGRVRPDSALFASLKSYYETHSKIYAKAALKARQKFLSENEIAKQNAANRAYTAERVRMKAENELFQKELDLNLDEAYRQLGVKRVKNPTQQRYTTRVNSSGWKNLDQYVMASTTSRATLDYKDPQSGKRVSIKYDTCNIEVNNLKSFDKVYVYAIPEKLNSYVRMKQADSTFSYSLNELIKYKMVAIGYIGETMYVQTKDQLVAGRHQIELQLKSEEEVQAILSAVAVNTSSNWLLDEYKNVKAEIQENKRIAKFNISEKLRRDIWTYVFPCSGGASGTEADVIGVAPSGSH
jgi:hypothetical protein